VRVRTAAHARVRITMQVTTKKIVVTGKGKKQKRSTQVSVRHIPLGVTVRTTVVVTKGKHRSTKVQTSVRYMTSVTVHADAHGSYTARLLVRYKTAKPTAALVIAQAQSGRDKSTHTAKVTITPPRHASATKHKATSHH
jgi:hypothetical protein